MMVDQDRGREIRREVTGGFSREQRLRKTRQFEHVFALRCSVSDPCLVVYVSPNELTWARLGLSVSRRVGNAVIRNRWKRSIREAFRRLSSHASGFDLVIVPRAGATPSFDAAYRSLQQLIRRGVRRCQGLRDR